MRVAIYARVSTEEQNTDTQLRDLRAYAKRMGWQGVVEYIEKESSVKTRPIFNGMISAAGSGKLDVILVWRIDRFARSMKGFVNITLQLDSWNVRLIYVTESVDTGDANPFAEFQRGLLALFAQLERKIIVARVRAGVAEAKRQGKHCGRPKKTFRRDLASQYRASGMSWRAIGRKLGVAHSTIRLALTEGVQKPSP